MKHRIIAVLAVAALLSLSPGPAQAQEIPTISLTGRVTDAESGEPLPGAHVFIASSMRGTTTGLDGTYELDGVPVGALRLYVSMIGFEPESKDMLLRNQPTRSFDFALRPKVFEVGEIVIEEKRDKHWKKRLERFTRLFIGETPNAEETKIMNPEVLDFTDSRGEFRAVASEPLIIENRALGYRVQYFLKEFVAEPRRTRYDGEPLFEELTADSHEQGALWEKNRVASFVGSFRHFLLALLVGKVEEQGFMTYARSVAGSSPADVIGRASTGTRFPIDAQEIIKDQDSPSEKLLDFDGFVEIIFTGEVEDESYLGWANTPHRRPKFQTSWIRLERGPTIIDYKGDVLDPYGVTFYGYLAFERVADEVPKEYRPR